jgi:hypothetical protein
VQIGNAGCHGFERCAPVGFLAQLFCGGVPLPARLRELLPGFVKLALRVLGTLLRQCKVRPASIRPEKPAGNRADRKPKKKE